MRKTATYSFGEDSPIKFQISDKLAENYNAATEKFFKAQQRFNQKFGRRWDPATEPIQIKWTRKEKKAWDEFAGIFNHQLTANGPWHVNDIMDDYLVKNGAEAAVKVALSIGTFIGAATMAGALYELLRAR